MIFLKRPFKFIIYIFGGGGGRPAQEFFTMLYDLWSALMVIDHWISS